MVAAMWRGDTEHPGDARLTAAVLVRAVGAVGLLVTLITGWDAGSVAQAFELLRGTSVTRRPGGWRERIHVNTTDR